MKDFRGLHTASNGLVYTVRDTPFVEGQLQILEHTDKEHVRVLFANCTVLRSGELQAYILRSRTYILGYPKRNGDIYWNTTTRFYRAETPAELLQSASTVRSTAPLEGYQRSQRARVPRVVATLPGFAGTGVRAVQ